MTQKEFYKSMPWLRARRAFVSSRILIDGGMCQVCGERPGKIVHHTVWLNDVNCNDPDIALNPELLRYECQLCHNKEVDPKKINNDTGRACYLPDGTVVKRGNY